MNRKSFELKFCFLFVSIAFAFFLGNIFRLFGEPCAFAGVAR